MISQLAGTTMCKISFEGVLALKRAGLVSTCRTVYSARLLEKGPTCRTVYSARLLEKGSNVKYTFKVE